MAAASSDRNSRQALVLALVALALPVIGFTSGLVQEALTIVLLGLVGGIVAVFALTIGIAAFRARRAAHESPTLAAVSIGISVFPILGALLLLPSLECYIGEGCGGG